MVIESKLYFSADFVLERTKDYTLLIRLSNADFSFAIVYQNSLLALAQNYPLSDLQYPDDLVIYLDQSYAKVIVGIIPPVFNIIPKQLFKESAMADYARLLDVAETDKVYSQTFDAHNQVIFKYYDAVLPFLSKRYPGHQLTFYYKGWLKALLATNPSAQNIYIDIQPEKMHIANFRDARLRFYNAFDAHDANEIIYFIALVVNDLEIAQEDAVVIVSGIADVNDDFLKTFAGYFKNIRINDAQQIGHLLNNIPPQHLLSLTALTLCA